MNIATRDFNLLLLFTLLYRERKASLVAERLSISQPALSHRLNRLRQEFKDPLFVRVAHGLTPTPKAHEIAPTIQDLVQKLEAFYFTEATIDLKSVEDTVYLFTTDYMEGLVIPQLLNRLQRDMPNVKLVTLNTQGAFPRKALEEGQCDIAIAGFYDQLPDTFYQKKIKEEEFKVLARSDHPLIQEGCTLEEYLSCQHIVTTISGNLDGVVDRALKKQKKVRQVMAGLSSFSIPPLVVSETDFILTCLGSIAERAEKQFTNLTQYMPPLTLPNAQIYQVWHERTKHDPVRIKIRDYITEILYL
ncbi:LysR family transcriptional regulator [Vibrio sp.]|nr:LysR family transcriptional regulator [Vibrio sp.]